VTEFVDPYFDDEHGCLRNRLGITDPDELGAREHAIVAVRQRQLDQRPGAPAATVDAWRAVHRHLFGDIYDWAGEFRTVNITKGTHTFHPASHLHIAADYCANAMRDIARLDRPNRDVLAERLSELLADMNEAHPFREGDGRTQRVIVGQLAAHHDHPIAWRVSSPIQNIELSIAAVDDPQAFARPIRIAMDFAADYDVSTASDPATGLGIDRRFDLDR